MLENACPLGRIFNQTDQSLTCSDSDSISALITISNQSEHDVNITYPTTSDTANQDANEQVKVFSCSSTRLSISLPRLSLKKYSYINTSPSSSSSDPTSSTSLVMMDEMNKLLSESKEKVWIIKTRGVKPPSKDRIFEITLKAHRANTFDALKQVLQEVSVSTCHPFYTLSLISLCLFSLTLSASLYILKHTCFIRHHH